MAGIAAGDRAIPLCVASISAGGRAIPLGDGVETCGGSGSDHKVRVDRQVAGDRVAGDADVERVCFGGRRVVVANGRPDRIGFDVERRAGDAEGRVIRKDGVGLKAPIKTGRE